MYLSTKNQRLETQKWFEVLRNQICSSFEKLEQNYEGPNNQCRRVNLDEKNGIEREEEEERCQ